MSAALLSCHGVDPPAKPLFNRVTPPSPLLNSSAFPPPIFTSIMAQWKGHHLPSPPTLLGHLHLPPTPIIGCPSRGSPHLTSPHTILLTSSLTSEHGPTACLRPPPPSSVVRLPHHHPTSGEWPIESPVLRSPSLPLAISLELRSSCRLSSDELLRSAMEAGPWCTRVPMVHDPWSEPTDFSVQK
jgi:hypothetical protein